MNEEIVDVVNERDEVIGREQKALKLTKGFISRVVGIFILNSSGKFIVCKRGPHKKNDANKYDLAAFGNVIAGESYEEAAKRELSEELGLCCSLERLDKFYQEISSGNNTLKIFCGVFLGKSDEEPKLNHELTEYRRMSLEEIEKEMRESPEKFCQGFINDFNRVKAKLLQAQG